jgi:hypothetical protein
MFQMQVPMQSGSEKGMYAPFSLPKISEVATRDDVTWELLAVDGILCSINTSLP